MSKMKLIPFNDAIAMSDDLPLRSLLLGNGFSRAFDDERFSYEALKGSADFAGNKEIMSVFETLKTNDFEKAVRYLRVVSRLLPCFEDSKVIHDKIHQYIEDIKSALIKSVAHIHPEYHFQMSEKQKNSCVGFLKNFIPRDNPGKIFTLNYDLLLYWALMHARKTNLFLFGDGFRKDSDTQMLFWDNTQDANVFYLHGALHIRDCGDEIVKLSWKKNETPLTEQIQSLIANNSFPLYVAEGSAKDKMTKILHNPYLFNGYMEFSKIEGSLFVYGMSLSSSDDHIMKAIGKGNISKLFIGIYGEPDNPTNRQILEKVLVLKSRRARNPLDVHYFDSNSAKIWE